MSYESLEYAGGEDFPNLWLSELVNGRVGMTYKVRKVLWSGESKFQRIEILDTWEYGKMLVLYGSVMTTDRDEFVYPEMLVHVPYWASGGARSALVIGGGDGFAVRELLRHRTVERVALVDIDGMVVEKCKEFFPDSRAALDDPRVTVVCGDGAAFVRDSSERWDLILVDAADPVPPADVLFKAEFYADCRRRLAPGGILSAQTESPFYHPDVLRDVTRTLRGLFGIVRTYTAWIPTYPSGLWSFTSCSDDRDPVRDFDRAGCLAAGLPTKYYNADLHAAAFQLPTFVRKLTEG